MHLQTRKTSGRGRRGSRTISPHCAASTHIGQPPHTGQPPHALGSLHSPVSLPTHWAANTTHWAASSLTSSSSSSMRVWYRASDFCEELHHQHQQQQQQQQWHCVGSEVCLCSRPTGRAAEWRRLQLSVNCVRARSLSPPALPPDMADLSCCQCRRYPGHCYVPPEACDLRLRRCIRRCYAAE